MYNEINYSIFNDRLSSNINLMFFGIEPEKEDSIIEYLKKGYHKLSDNHQTNFISVVYNISKYVIPKFSNKYSKHKIFFSSIVICIILLPLESLESNLALYLCKICKIVLNIVQIRRNFLYIIVLIKVLILDYE